MSGDTVHETARNTRATPVQTTIMRSAVVLALLVLGSALADDDNQLWRQHASRVRRAACSPEPRERVVTLQELGVETPSSYSLSPPASALRRCDDNPVCCGAGQAWTAVGSEPVQLVFAVRNMVNTSEDLTYRTVSAENHTSCACR